MKAFVTGLLAASLCAAMGPAHPQARYGDPGTPVAGKALGTVIHTRDVDELRYVILKRLTDRYAEQKRITVTQGEMDAYVRHVQEGLARDRARQAARRDELTRRLSAQGLSEAERKSLASELEAANRALEALAEPTGDPQEIKTARDQIAAAFIRQWKINQALYRQYGGRIVFQQGGPEPLDAYRRFLEEREAHGDLEILDKDLELAFWRYYSNDTIHSFYPRGSKEEAQAFAAPPWMSN